jgi:hypothetical protein
MEKRCTDIAGRFEGKKRATLEEARATKAKGAEMMNRSPRMKIRTSPAR